MKGILYTGKDISHVAHIGLLWDWRQVKTYYIATPKIPITEHRERFNIQADLLANNRGLTVKVIYYLRIENEQPFESEITTQGTGETTLKVHVFPQEYFSWDTKDPQGVLQAWIDNQPEWTYLTSRDGLCSLSPCQLRVLGTEEKGVIIEETGLALLCLSKMREMGLIINPQPIEFSLHEVLVELGQVIEHTKTRAAYPFTHGISAIPLHKTRMWVTLRTMIRVHDFWFWWKHQASHTARVFFLAEVLHNRTDNELATLANYDYPLAFEQSRALLPEEIEALIRAYNEYRQ